MVRDLKPVLAAIRYDKDFDINAVLRGVVKRLRERGVIVGGVLQELGVGLDECSAPLNIVDIRTGRAERITQDRGLGSRGCKLDPRGLAAISHCITDAVDAGADLVIINKFGKAESEGDGLRSCIEDAIVAGVPILTSVREPYIAAWNLYHGGLATELPPQVEAIVRWHDACCSYQKLGNTVPG
ncbi:MAG: DUF2478 domain-containing protein [Xanthobacteraceae bacterium]